MKKSLVKECLTAAGLWAVMAAGLVSCGIEEIGGVPDKNGVWVRPEMGGDAGVKEKAVAYMTAVAYPEGYDWRADREKGSVKCSLVVYRDGIAMMKVPVGDRYEVSSDPDMNRMMGGHLYTDYSSGTETVIKRDGVEMFRYPGREMICDIAEKEGDIYTLGHSRDGDGFAYRKNGKVIIEKTRGRTFGRLHPGGDSLCFAFCEPIEAVGEELERYYMATGGDVVQTAVREDVKKVWDIAIHKGELYYLASIVGVSAPVLFTPEKMQALRMPTQATMLTCRIITQVDALYVEGIYKRSGKPLTSGLWDESGQSHLFTEGLTVSSICIGGDGVCCALNGPSPAEPGQIYRCGDTSPMPDGYASIGASITAMVNGILNAGLSSLTSGPPLIWRDGETTTLNINGFISGISTD